MKIQTVKKTASQLRLLFEFLLCVVILADADEKTQLGEVPQGVMDIVSNYLNDKTSYYYFDSIVANHDWIDNSKVKITDIKVGYPMQNHSLNLLENDAENKPIKELVRPIDVWKVPIWAHDKCIYSLKIAYFQDRFQIVGCAGKSFNAKHFSTMDRYTEVRKMIPESTGFHPILIYCNHRYFIHFPQKDDYNLIYLRIVKSDPLDSLYGYSRSNTLIDKSIIDKSSANSRKILSHLRRETIERKQKAKEETDE